MTAGAEAGAGPWTHLSAAGSGATETKCLVREGHAKKDNLKNSHAVSTPSSVEMFNKCTKTKKITSKMSSQNQMGI